MNKTESQITKASSLSELASIAERVDSYGLTGKSHERFLAAMNKRTAELTPPPTANELREQDAATLEESRKLAIEHGLPITTATQTPRKRRSVSLTIIDEPHTEVECKPIKETIGVGEPVATTARKRTRYPDPVKLGEAYGKTPKGKKAVLVTGTDMGKTTALPKVRARKSTKPNPALEN